MPRPEAVAEEMELLDLDAVLHLLVGELHHAIEIAGVVLRAAGDAGGRGGDDELGLGGRRQRDDMVATLKEGPLQILALDRVGTGAGAGDQEDQRRRLDLVDQRELQLVGIPEDLGYLAVGKDRQPQVVAVDVVRHLGRLAGGVPATVAASGSTMV